MGRQLIDYLPPVLREAGDIRRLMAAQQPEADALWAAMDGALSDRFVRDATLNGIKRWEGVIGITPRAAYTLDERRFAILARLAERLPYTVRTMRAMLAGLCGENGYRAGLSGYTLSVLVALTQQHTIDDVGAMLRRVCPANIVIGLSIEYNQHYKLRPFTHAELSAKTHDKWRSGML